MYVKKIDIRSFRNLRDISLGPFSSPGENAELIALAGPNGGGKSSILELIGWAMTATSRSIGFHSVRSNEDFRGSIEFGFTSDELDALRAASAINDHSMAMRAYFEANDSVTVAFDPGPVQGYGNSSVSTYQFATNYLREVHRSASGVFIRADRTYPKITFNNGAIFEFERTKLPLHAEQFSFGDPGSQFRDLYDHLAQQNYHYEANLGRFQIRLERGQEVIANRPVNPLAPYSKLLNKILPQYQFSDSREGIPNDLYVNLPSGAEISFGDLSSGEKEAFLLLAMFLRYDIKNATVLIDEPEMHLHPELSRALVRELQFVAPRSQIWMATHNPEIIDEVGRDRVYYVAPATGDETASSVLSASEESVWATQLRGLFGESGYVGIGKTFLFTEGDATSVDRKTFATLFPKYSNRLKIVPSGGFESHVRINSAVLSLLEENLAWIRFYLVRDRDYMTPEMADRYKEKSVGRIHILDRCQIENYVLDFDAMSQVMRDVWGRNDSPSQLRRKFYGIAQGMSGEIVAALTSFRLNQLVMPQDFSFPKLFANESVIAASGGVAENKLRTLVEFASRRAKEVQEHVNESTDPDRIEALVISWTNEIVSSLATEEGGWANLFPAKELFRKFAKLEKLGPEVGVINSTLRVMAEMNSIPQELSDLIEDAVNGNSLT